MDGAQKGAPNLFSGALIYLIITKKEYKVQKNMRIKLKKKLLGAQIFFSPGPQIP